MDNEELASAYLRALANSDVEEMLRLFAEDGVVSSPLYGHQRAADFYPRLFDDTSEARLTLKGVTEGRTVEGVPLVSIWFHFDWRLPSGRPAPFEVVDLAELDADGRIAVLRIVYDTVDVRPAFEDEVGTSWRSHGP